MNQINIPYLLLRTSIHKFYLHRPLLGCVERQLENSYGIFHRPMKIGLNNSLLNIMSTTQTYKNDIEDQITS